MKSAKEKLERHEQRPVRGHSWLPNEIIERGGFKDVSISPKEAGERLAEKLMRKFDRPVSKTKT